MMKQKIKTQFGVTLIELMIAMAISSILLIGVVSIYTNSKRNYVTNEEFALLQENGRMAMKFLVEDIRMAGFMGCARNDGDDTKFQCYLDNTGNSNFICDNLTIRAITGYDAVDPDTSTTGTIEITTFDSSDPNSVLKNGVSSNWVKNTSATLPASFPLPTATPSPTDTGQPVIGSDIIIVRHGAGKGAKIAENSANGANIKFPGTVSGNCETGTGICAGDILLAGDCKQARVFQATSLSQASGNVNVLHAERDANNYPGNDDTSWAGPNQHEFSSDDTEVLTLQTYAYYVGNNPNGQPALYRHNGIKDQPAEELVEGIENMQILYGVDSDLTPDGIANYYTTADKLKFDSSDPTIVSVRISLLVRTNEQLPNKTSISDTYPMAGIDVKNVTSDGRLRKFFTTTIKIRNKGL